MALYFPKIENEIIYAIIIISIIKKLKIIYANKAYLLIIRYFLKLSNYNKDKAIRVSILI